MAGNVTSLPIKVAGTISPYDSRNISIHVQSVNKRCLTITSSRDCNQHEPKGSRDAIE